MVGGGDSIPANFKDMKAAMLRVPAFAAGFANIMLFWYGHHVWSRRFGLETAGSIFLSALLVFVVLICVYPLRAIYSGAVEFFSAGYLESYFRLESVEDLRSMFVMFGSGYAALAGVIALLNRYALAHSAELGLDELERFDTVTTCQRWALHVIVPAISIVIALGVPDSLVVLAGLVYGSFGILMPAHSIRRARRRPAPAGGERD